MALLGACCFNETGYLTTFFFSFPPHLQFVSTFPLLVCCVSAWMGVFLTQAAHLGILTWGAIMTFKIGNSSYSFVVMSRQSVIDRSCWVLISDRSLHECPNTLYEYDFYFCMFCHQPISFGYHSADVYISVCYPQHSMCSDPNIIDHLIRSPN
jgi:hypothetical protein